MKEDRTYSKGEFHKFPYDQLSTEEIEGMHGWVFSRAEPGKNTTIEIIDYDGSAEIWEVPDLIEKLILLREEFAVDDRLKMIKKALDF